MIFNSESRCISYISYILVSKKCIACRKDINTTHMYCTHLWASKILLLGSVRIHLLTRFPRYPLLVYHGILYKLIRITFASQMQTKIPVILKSHR